MICEVKFHLFHSCHLLGDLDDFRQFFFPCLFFGAKLAHKQRFWPRNLGSCETFIPGGRAGNPFKTKKKRGCNYPPWHWQQTKKKPEKWIGLEDDDCVAFLLGDIQGLFSGRTQPMDSHPQAPNQGGQVNFRMMPFIWNFRTLFGRLYCK